jgi:hypothetical protein
VNIPGTGWGIWTVASKTITLPAGNQRIRVYASTSTWDLDYLEIIK